jgi:hypothetical protein
MFPNANRLVTFCVGLVFLGLGVCGLIHPLVQSPPPGQTTAQGMLIETNFGFLFGIFAMNIVSDILFIAVGAAGIIAAYSVSTSRWYEQMVFSLCVAFAVLGFLPLGINRLWGVMPLFGWLDAFFLIVALFTFYFAFVEPPTLPHVLDGPVHGDDRPENPPQMPPSHLSHS